PPAGGRGETLIPLSPSTGRGPGRGVVVRDNLARKTKEPDHVPTCRDAVRPYRPFTARRASPVRRGQARQGIREDPGEGQGREGSRACRALARRTKESRGRGRA